jgi:hypothetical protein
MNCDPFIDWKVKFPDNTGWDKEAEKPQVQGSRQVVGSFDEITMNFF